ncbi:LacI family DNA-binding transcriptional regulator [Mesorhizobium newzealandense]|uniref:LacI family DNA-binding transcriptional regulator n=3 Tax=Mesorhizobium TaxID=68287 RepID=A0ABW4WGP7_9HYPH|nr:LacI family DNA-binding transcriptional regulator [Mesorhizobium sophorae]
MTTKKRITLREVAEAVGVHVSTVSRALGPNTRHLINSDVVEQVIRASRQMDYRRHAAAYSLKTNRTKTVGVIVPDITNAIFPPMIRGIEDSLSTAGYLAIVGNTDGDNERERTLLDTLVGRGIDGLILASVERKDDVFDLAASESIPIVTVNRRPDRDSVHSIVHDESEGVRRALTHLVSLGHRRIAMIAGPQTLSTGAERYAAFVQSRSSLNLDSDESLVAFAQAYNESAGEHCVEELIAAGHTFTAILCANDRLAVGALAALSRRNLICPKDVSVTGYNDMPMVDRIDPPLTTIRIQQYRMGFEAGSMLQKLMNGESPAQVVVLPVELVIRSSTARVLDGR